jgi:hypothetical protein
MQSAGYFWCCHNPLTNNWLVQPWQPLTVLFINDKLPTSSDAKLAFFCEEKEFFDESYIDWIYRNRLSDEIPWSF